MNKSYSRDRVKLTVRAADNATEIFLVDGRLERIARDVGTLETNVVPGVYKVRLRSGQSQIDNLIEVRPGTGAVTFEGPAVEFATAAPLAQTLTGAQNHQDAAHELSLSTNLKPGSSSWLYLFARDLAPEPAPESWSSVSLHDLAGKELATLTQGDYDLQNGFCGLNLELDPGTYRLRVDIGKPQAYELFVVTVEGWQTQVFAMVEDVSSPGGVVRRPSLPTVSMFMAQAGQGFDPKSPTARQTELVRLGLVSGRPVLTKSEATRLLEQPSLNPMLGIYGTHFLLRQRRTDYALVRAMIDRLGAPFASHPDVQALLLNRNLAEPQRSLVFATPPMLRSSWQLVVHASRRRMGIVPQGTLVDQIADGVLYTAPWLVHRLDTSVSEQTYNVSFAQASRAVQRLLNLEPEQRARFRADLEQPETASQFTPLEQNLLNATILKPQIFVPGDEDQALPHKTPSTAQVLRPIDAPNYSVARAMQSIIDKLDKDLFGE